MTELENILETLDHLEDLDLEKRKAQNQTLSLEFEGPGRMARTYLTAVYELVVKSVGRRIRLEILHDLPIDVVLVAQVVWFFSPC